MTITRRSAILGLTAGALAPSRAFAQRKIVKLIVPAAPGGAIDVIGRLYAQRIAPALDESWVIENKAGASNTLGAAEVARAAPDGATYLTNADIHIMARHVMRSVSYDPLADFTPISRFASSPIVLIGATARTPETMPALIANMKAEPDKYTFANSALGSMGHLATESFKRRTGTTAGLVNYRGTAPAITDVVAGQVSLMVAPLGSALPFVTDGKVRAFAIMGAQRSPLLPNLPTAGELGLPDLNFTLWYGLWGPKGLPAATVQRVNATVQAASRDREIVDKLTALGAEPVTEDAASFKAFIEAEHQRVTRVVEEAGIKPG
ncbi:Bug family tripartite tricarboxylate transporter substrate binding protein [Bosea sp. (in: a-proteobacteria)]|uniref:Bug family tripartite tricarboxylate transporter substrate binding protein n=1 Tax=Bosea sp. (in: a-proteobacteria) TaxID=1871050 RepID=UPI003F715EF7